MDGPSVLKALHQSAQLKNTPVAFMTAKVQPHEIEHFKSLGAVGVIAKPFDPMTLSQLVRELWQKAEAPA
jgi:CheY-like chemotaxis protein